MAARVGAKRRMANTMAKFIKALEVLYPKSTKRTLSKIQKIATARGLFSCPKIEPKGPIKTMEKITSKIALTTRAQRSLFFSDLISAFLIEDFKSPGFIWSML